VADYTRVYTTDVSSSEILDMAEAYQVGLRGLSVPLGHEPTPNSAEFRLRGGLLGALVGGYLTARLTAEERGAKTRLTITTNREQLLEALDAWASRELGATTVG
jgi:hypothetical protein